MLKINYKFLLISLIVLAGSLVQANDDVTMVSLDRLKHLKIAVVCEQAKRDLLVDVLKCSLLTAQFKLVPLITRKPLSSQEENSFRKKISTYLAWNSLPLIINGYQWLKLRNKKDDNDLVIQNNLATMHLRNALYCAAQVSTVTNEVVSGNQVEIQEKLNQGVDYFACLLPESVKTDFNKIGINVKNITDSMQSYVVMSWFSNSYLSAVVDLGLGLHKKLGILKNISAKEKHISKELFALLPPETQAPSAVSLIVDSGLKSCIGLSLNNPDPRLGPIALEILKPWIAKLAVPLVIKP